MSRESDPIRPLTSHEEERLAAYLAGTMTPEEQTAFESDALREEALAEALYREELLAGAIVEAGATTADARVTERMTERPRQVPSDESRRVDREDRGPFDWFRRRLTWAPIARWQLATAVAALGALLLVWNVADHRTETFRGPESRSIPIAPVGELGSPPELYRWTPDDRAASYRILVYDRAARVIWETVTVESVATPPAGEPADTLRSGFWRVVPLDATGAALPAPPPAHFSVR